ncbi:uncharacterized protein LOC116851357 [Odontomachus brunneus]|uniref:uncharacterized protein LOC116851357 n=1 Tax=Odontomachus brunneus TaxID=486640 RepID=UPI0013F1AA75|nr:uncharacterized protein LOC116851357 [Odontomachus brunneus]
MAAYSNEEYYDMLMALGECRGETTIAARRYTELYPNRARHPAASVILAAAQRIRETGSVLPKKRDTGCNRHARNLKRLFLLSRKNPKQVFGLLLESTDYHIPLFKELWQTKNYTHIITLVCKTYENRIINREECFIIKRSEEGIRVLKEQAKHNQDTTTRASKSAAPEEAVEK